METLQNDNVNATERKNRATTSVLEGRIDFLDKTIDEFSLRARTQGGLGSAVAGYSIRRLTEQKVSLEAIVAKNNEEKRQKLIGFIPEGQRELAQNLPLDVIQASLVEIFNANLKPKEAREPLSPEGKRAADVESGLISSEQANSNQFNITPEIRGIEDLGERANAIEKLADDNAQAGNFKLSRDQRKTVNGLRKEKGLINKDVGKLAKGLDDSGFTGMIDALEKSVSIINEDVNIPGAGATGVNPEFLLSGRGKKLRSSIATVRNAILAARSGKAVTPSEASRLLEEIGVGKGRTDEQLRTGIKNAIDILKTKIGTIQSGVRPRSVKIFKERGNDPFARLEALNITDFTGQSTEKSKVVGGVVGDLLQRQNKPTPEQARRELEKRGEL